MGKEEGILADNRFPVIFQVALRILLRMSPSATQSKKALPMEKTVIRLRTRSRSSVAKQIYIAQPGNDIASLWTAGTDYYNGAKEVVDN